MLNNTLISIVIAVCASLFIIGSFIVVQRARREKYLMENAQLDEIISMNDDEFDKKRITIFNRWNNHWNKLFKSMGWERYADNTNAGREVLAAFIAITVLGYVLLNNFFLSLTIALIFLYLLQTIIRNRVNTREERLNTQLPGFLQNLKANIQANETPERAILKIVDNMPSPLYEDLRMVKDKILSNSTFTEAVEALSAKTKSNDLKFLCACMIQSANVGSNMEDQITIIEKQLEARARLNRERNKAVKSALPALWVATVAIPVSFIASIFLNAEAKEFWFHQPISYILLAAVLGLYALAIWGTKYQVDKIKNL